MASGQAVEAEALDLRDAHLARRAALFFTPRRVLGVVGEPAVSSKMLLFTGVVSFSGASTRFSVHLKCDGTALRSKFAELSDPSSDNYAKWLMVSSASRSGRKVKRKSERRALVDKGAPKTYGKCAAPASRSKGEGFYEL